MRLALQPGRLDLLGAGVRWTRFAWIESTPAAPMRLDVEATLDPVPIAPLLRAAQPDFGWGGDLSVGGTVTVRSEPRVHADVVVERHTGDLFVIDETGTQALGLTDLRLGLVADNGVSELHPGTGRQHPRRGGRRDRRAHHAGATWPAPRRRSRACSSCRSRTSANRARGYRPDGGSAARCA